MEVTCSITAQTAAVAVTGVADIEESVWLPRLGLKGMIDASVSLRVLPVSAGGRQPPGSAQVYALTAHTV